MHYIFLFSAVYCICGRNKLCYAINIFFFSSKWWLLIFSGGNHPLMRHLWRLTLPPWRGYPRFFSSKWTQRMYFSLTRWLRSLSFWFWGDREKSRGVVPPWKDEGIKENTNNGPFKLPYFSIGKRLPKLVCCIVTCFARTNIRNAQSCFERLASADVDRCKVTKSECTIRISSMKVK